MMNILADIINSFRSKKPRFWIAITLIISLPCMVIYFVNTYAIITISLKSGGSAVSLEASGDYFRKAFGQNSGTFIIPKTTNNIIATNTAYRKSITPIAIPWYSYASTTIEIQSDKNAEKVAYLSRGNPGCTIYNDSINTLLRYDCNHFGELQRYDITKWMNVKYAPMIQPATSIKPYNGGAIAITYSSNTDSLTPGPIGIIDKTGKTSTFQAPEGIDLSLLELATISTDTTDPTNDRFVLSLWSGDVYLGTPTKTGVDYTLKSAPQDYNPSLDKTFCSIAQDKVACYRGDSISTVKPESENDRQTPPPNKQHVKSLSMYSFSGSESQLTISDTTVLPQYIYMTLDGTIYGLQDKKLYVFEANNDQAQTATVATNVSAAKAGRDLYFIQNNGVFKVNEADKSSHQVFYSDNILPSALDIYADNIFVIAKIKGMGENYHAYLLNSEENTSPGRRTIDLLPNSNVLATSMMLVSDNLNITLPVTLQKGAKASSTLINNQELSVAQQEALNSISDLGVDLDSLNITFSY